MISKNDLLTRISLYITASVLFFSAATKFIMVLSEPIIPKTPLETREFLIVQSMLITGLAIWLICGFFKKAGWLLAVLAFTVFIADSLYKAFSGAASCGCFGQVEVNPWITVCLIDLPILIMLIVFRPKGIKLCPPPWPTFDHFIATAIPTVLLLTAMGWTMAKYVPPAQTDDYIYVEKDKWQGNKFEYLNDIDIADQLADGLAVVLFYHNDCPNCIEAMPIYSEFNDIISLSEQKITFAFIQLPPYDMEVESPVPAGTNCLLGKLSKERKWLTATPLLVVLEDGVVVKLWEAEVPMDLDELLEDIFN